MSELLTMQDLANGHLDIKALGEAANGDENTIVTTRTGNTYPSAERAINIMFQNGGLPATPFATKSLMTASALIDGDYAMVTDDTVNNGLYVKTAGAWVKSSYDPALKAIDFFKSISDLHLLPSSSTEVNYDIASKTLSFEGSVRLINGSTNIVVPTPSSITFPVNGLYRIIYDHSTQSLGFDEFRAPHKSKQSFVAACDVTTVGFVAYEIPNYTVNGKANTVKTEGSYYGNVTTNWIYSSISGSGTLTGVGGKGRLLSDLIPLKGTINVESSDPNIRIGLMVYNKDGSANRLILRDTTVSEKVDGYYRVIISYEDSSDLELTDADKVSITAKANIPDELMKHTEIIPKLELGGISYVSGEYVRSSSAFRTIDFIKMSGTVSVKPISPDAEIRLYLYDKDKEFVRSFTNTLYVPEISGADVDGYFKLTVKYMTDKDGELSPDALAVKVTAASLTDSLSSGSSTTLDALKSLPNSTFNLNSGDMWRDKNKLAYLRNTPTLLNLSIFDTFNTHAEIYAFLDRLVDDFPDYVSKFTVGTSGLGVPIYGYKFIPKLLNGYNPSYVSRHEHVEGFIPKIVFNGGIHGNETHNILANMLFVDDICRQWQDVENYAEMRWGMQMVYVPLVNPDGYNARTANNGDNTNINRTFGTENPTSEASAMMSLLTEHSDAFAYIDHHRCYAESAKIWIGTNSTSHLGLVYRVLRDVSIEARKTNSSLGVDTAPVAALTTAVLTSASGWNYDANSVPSFLLETPDHIGVGASNRGATTLHARDAVATLIWRLYDAKIKKLEREGFNNP